MRPFAQLPLGERLSRHLGGLSIRPRNWSRAGLATLAVVAGVTLSVLLLDCVVFRSMLPDEYVKYYTSPLWPRTILICLKAVQEEVIRLIVMSALVGLGQLVLRRTPPAIFILAAVVSQLFLIWPFVFDFGTYEVLRYWAVGSVWGLLYWRHGWLAALLGHASIHLILDPLLLALL